MSRTLMEVRAPPHEKLGREGASQLEELTQSTEVWGMFGVFEEWRVISKEH